MFPLEPSIEYTALPFSTFLSRTESWHGLAQYGTLDLCYDYDSEVESVEAVAGAIIIKPDKEKSTEKIDGAVAIMALDRAIRCGNDASASVYDSRGILFV